MPRSTRGKRTDRNAPSGRLRIVAGKWRRRLLPVADAPGLRPTGDRVRETLFNWLAPVIEGAHCLDLYAGSGALGLEALSRGAASCVFVERSAEVVKVLQHCIDLLSADAAEVLQRDAIGYLESAEVRPFDVVFLDPPFAADAAKVLCSLLHERGWLAAGGRVYLEQDAGQEMPALPAGWRVEKEKTAGRVRFALFRSAS